MSLGSTKGLSGFCSGELLSHRRLRQEIALKKRLQTITIYCFLHMLWKHTSAQHEPSFERYISSSDCLVGGAWSHIVGQPLFKMHHSPAARVRIQ